jgi:hypothetical protein
MDPKDLFRTLDLSFPRIDPSAFEMRDYNAERQHEMIRSIKSAPQVHAQNVQAAILAHIKDLQDNLKRIEPIQNRSHPIVHHSEQSPAAY